MTSGGAHPDVNPLYGRAIAGVVADMDGLLLDTERIVRSGWQRAAREVGHAMSDALYAELLGRTESDALARLVESFGPDWAEAEFLARARSYTGELLTAQPVPLRPGAQALIDVLARHQIRRAIATSTARHEARPRLERSGIWTAFDAVVCGDEVIRGKPAPDIYLSAAAAIGVAPHACLALEDSDAGARAAIAAGMIVVVVPDLGTPGAETCAACAAVARSLDEVAAWLGQVLAAPAPVAR
jgi:HAD superfamily hydrolase (TIGR01509 family)